jgi:hypothetical protein
MPDCIDTRRGGSDMADRLCVLRLQTGARETREYTEAHQAYDVLLVASPVT